MPTVYIVNKSSHNYSSAEQFGNLVFMSDGRMNRYATNDMVRRFSEHLRHSNKDDYILLCSLNVMNSIACSLFARKHGALNLLLYKKGGYIERNHILDI